MIKIPTNLLYPDSLEKAQAIQKELAQKVIKEDAFDTIHIVAGTDVSNNIGPTSREIFAAIISLKSSNLQQIESGQSNTFASLDYIPGFLGFREVPAIINAYKQLRQKPDLILVDGHGISHPRGLGIASHLGVLLDCPTVGVAKSIMTGELESDLEQPLGSIAYLKQGNQTIGAALRTKMNSLPVYVSTGHKVGLESAIKWVLHCTTRYRLPEPTRLAHLHANQHRQASLTNQLSLF